MSQPRPPSRFPDHGLRSWLSPDGPLLARLRGVFRLDSEVLAEIAADPHALGQALAIVLATSVLIGIGRLNPLLAFGVTAVAILVWGVATSLVWAAGVIALPDPPDFGRLLRVSGYAYAWTALRLGTELPLIGWMLAWLGLAGWIAVLVIGARNVMGTSTAKTVAICAGGLGLPFAIAWMFAL